MNASTDLLDHAAAVADLDALLAPLSPEAPCGPSIRHDAVFTEIRLLREEDDPSLPMGQWERPLKRADWPRIETLCTAILGTRSKDLQLAAWLAESWARQRGVPGLLDGLRLVGALLPRYWSCLHPGIDGDGDSEARLAPFEWMNGALSTCVRVQVPLVSVDGDKPIVLTLALWERLTVHEGEASAGTTRGPLDAAPLTRAHVQASAQAAPAALAQTGAAIRDSLDALRAIAFFLHEVLGDEAPNLGKLEGTLEAALRVLAHCQPDDMIALAQHEQTVDDDAAAVAKAGLEDVVAAGAMHAPLEMTHWRNRHEAYRTLEALADYLSEVEPHSPTPFLLRRAASWGRMSLPDVITEIIREEGDVNRLLQILGVKM